MTRSKKSLKNFSFGIAKSLIMMVLGLWTTPLIISLLGREAFGQFKAMHEFQGYLGVLFVSIYSGLIILMNQINAKTAVDSERELQLHQIYGQGIRRYMAIALVALLSGILATVPAAKILNVPLSDFWGATPIAISYYILLISNFFLFGQVFQADLDSRQRNDLVQVGLFLQSIVVIAVTILFAHFNFGVMANALGVFFGFFCSTLFFMTKVPLRWSLLFKQTIHSKHEDRALGALFKTSAINDIAGKITMFSDNIVISAFLGPQAVTGFFLSQRLPTILLSNLIMLGGSVWAGLGDLYHRGDSMERMRSNVLRLIRVQTLFGMAVLTPALLFNAEFVRLWVGSDFYLGDSLAMVATLNVFIQSLISLWGWIFVAIGRTNLMTQLLWAQAIVNLVASLLFTYYFGAIGPLLGTLCSYGFVAAWKLPELIGRELQIPHWQMQRSWLEGLLLSIILSAIAWQFKYLVTINHVWQLLLWLSLVGILVAAVGVVLILRTEDRAMLWQFIQKIKNRGQS